MQNIFSPVWLLFASFLAIISCSYKPKDTDCDKFRNGEFFIKATRYTPSYSVRRIDSLQFETNNETKSVRIFNVKWINPCEYELRLIHKPADSTTLNQSALRNSLEKITSSIVIVKTTPNYYLFKIKKEGISMELVDTMWVQE
jgi:hypothetical protein